MGFKWDNFQPVGAGLDRNCQWDSESECFLHDRLHQRYQCIHFPMRAFKYQFIMNLQQHAALEILFLETSGYLDHRQFDQIRSRSLDWSVDSHPLTELPRDHLWAFKLWNIAAAAQQSLDEPVPSSCL